MQKIFKKGCIYKSDSDIFYVMCVETTCSNTSNTFKAVIVYNKESKTPFSYESIGNLRDFNCENYKLLTEPLIIQSQ